MTQNSVFAIRLLEKIGAPLVAAIESAPPEGDNPEVGAAEMMAKMLGQAVQISIKLSTALQAEETEEQADSTRLSMAAIATPLLADFYVKNKRVPEEADITRMTKSLEAVIGFADKFTPAADGQSRLTTIDNEIPFFDATQAILTTMQALTPALLAISEFSFGQSDTKLMQEVSTKLEEKAAELAGSPENKLGQILVLKSLATIYAGCHRAEVEKMSSGDNQGEAPSMTPVWEAFEKRTMMMQALVGQNVQSETVESSGEGAPVAPVAEQPVTEASPAQAAPTPAEIPVTPPPAAPAQNAAPAAGGSPMGFFKPGGNTDAVPAQAAPATPPPVTPAAEPEQKPEEAKDQTASNFDSTSAPPANPMGFFKPGAKKEDE